jgi:DNA-binding XRE family transcriptional regulator
MNVKEYIGVKIKEKRKEAKISQEMLAEYLGYTRTSIVNIEAGRQGLPSDVFWMVCNALHCTPNDLFPDTSPAKHKFKTIEKTVYVRVPKTIKVKKITL